MTCVRLMSVFGGDVCSRVCVCERAIDGLTARRAKVMPYAEFITFLGVSKLEFIAQQGSIIEIEKYKKYAVKNLRNILYFCADL